MKRRQSYIANEIVTEYRRDKRMYKKAMILKKFKDNKTGIVKLQEEKDK